MHERGALDAVATGHDAPPPPVKVLLINSIMMGGGVDSHTLTLAQALLGAGEKVTLAMPAASRWLAIARALPGLEVLAMEVPRQLWPVVLARLAHRQGMHVVHAHHGRDYWLAVVTSALAFANLKVVVTRHLMTPLKRRSRLLLQWGRAYVIAVSDAVLRGLEPVGSLPVERIRCGIDTLRSAPRPAVRARERARLNYQEDNVVFAVVGPIQSPEGKGQFYFVEAASLMAASYPHARFLCVGDGDSVNALRTRAAQLGIVERLAIHPFSDDLPSLMQAVDVLVHPAVGSEALGLVILEAMACAKPVIGSDLDGISETFRDPEQGILVAPRSAAALAHAMSRLADDSRLRVDMGRRGLAWVHEEFSLTKLGAETASLYRRCLLRNA